MKFTIPIVCLVLGILIAFPKDLSPSEEEPSIRWAKIEEMFKQVAELQELSKPLPKPKTRYGFSVTAEYGDYLPLLSQYDWDISIATAILLAESGGNSGAVNWNDNHRVCVGSHGLFQLACFWGPHFGYSVEDLHTPAINIELAYRIYSAQGWKPWSAYTNGSYLRYMQ